MTPTPEGKQLAADLANAGLRPTIIIAGPMIGLGWLLFVETVRVLLAGCAS